MSNHIKKIFYVVLTLLSAMLLFWKCFFNQIPIPYRMDYIRFLTQQIRVVFDMKAGHFPLWNPYILCGMPTIANVMSNLFSPFFPIYFLIKDPITAYVLVMIAELSILGITFFYMMRSVFNVDRKAAYLSAITFTLSGYSLWLLNNSLRSMFQDPLFLLPLLFVFYDKLRKNITLKNALIIALIITISNLNGNANILHVAYNTTFILIFHFHFMVRRQSPFRQELKITAFLLAAIFLGLTLCAFQFFPVYEAITQSTRFSGEVAYSPMKPFPIAISFIYPDIWPKFPFVKAIGGFYGLKYGVVGYCGIPSLVLALLGAMYSSNKKKWFFIILPSLYLLMWPIYTSDLIQSILPMKLKSGNHFFYSFYLYSFCVAVLVGLGLNVLRLNLQNLKEFICSKKISVKVIKYFSIAVLIFYIAVFVSISGFRLLESKITPILKKEFIKRAETNENLQRSSEFYNDKLDYLIDVFNKHYPLFTFSAFIKILGLLFILTIIFKKSKYKFYLFYGIAGCVLLDHVSVSWQYLEFLPKDYYYKETPTVKFLKDKAETEIFRVGVLFEDSTFFNKNYPDASFKDFLDFSTNLKESLHENILIKHGIQIVGAFDALCPARQNEYFGLMGRNNTGFGSHGIFLSKLDSHLLDLVNMKYVVSPIELSIDKFEKVLTGNRYFVYENKKAFPRAYWVPESVFVESKQDLLDKLSANKIDFNRKVLISEIKPPKHGTTDGYIDYTGATVSIKKYSPNSIMIQTNYKHDGWLVVSDAYYPGWKAYVDGTKIDIYPANHLLRAIPVKAGNHTVTMSYFSDYMRVGIWVSGFSVIMCIGLVLIGFLNKKKNL